MEEAVNATRAVHADVLSSCTVIDRNGFTPAVVTLSSECNLICETEILVIMAKHYFQYGGSFGRLYAEAAFGERFAVKQ